MSTALPVRLRQGAARNASIEYCAISDLHDAREVEENLKRAPRQRELWQLLQTEGPMPVSAVVAAGFKADVLRQLARKGLLQRYEETPPPVASVGTEPADANAASEIKLNDDQRQAVDAILAASEKFSCFLLDGVTGSGKTEVYIQAMAEVLSQGRQCLLLVPEIGLTPQTVSRFEARFNCPIVSLHSGLNDTERLTAWRMAHSGEAGIVIGTRSAVFTSLARPGIIVIDEEHDASFKQQDGFRYSARDLAVMRAREEKIPVILGSATPSLETLFNARQGRYTHLRMPHRSGSARAATMQLVDVEQQVLDQGFSESVLEQLGQHLNSGNQVLVFINRRGFAPVLQCQTCGWLAECDDCVAQMTVHAQPPALRCHHCNKQERLPLACPKCAGRQLSTLGLGTQKIESHLRRRFADYPVIRIDRDSTRSRKRFASMLDQVNSGEACILLGTQMLAKGHHFPGITLVIIVDADSGLFSADFRGQEHMAQTIVQVAGRAGRAERRGEVLIQSRHSSHETLQALTQLDYNEFARQLLREREAAQMPPYAHLALLRSEARSANTALGYLQSLVAEVQPLLKNQFQVDCLGPMPSPMEKRAGRFRAQLLLSSRDRAQLHGLLARLVHIAEQSRTPAGLRWSLDVDPQDMI